MLFIDEVYVKPMLLYHGRQLFSSSVSDNTQLEETVLAFETVYLYVGPKLLIKMLPISKSEFRYLFLV